MGDFDVEKARQHAYQGRHDPGFLSGDLTHACDEIVALREKLAGLGEALSQLVNACYPIDMWLGGVWANPPSHDERHAFLLALSRAIAIEIDKRVGRMR